MNSLVKLAIEKKLPKHQYIDRTTLAWIKDHKPEGYNESTKIPSISQELIQILKDYAPNTEWFLEPKTINSIHGLRHILRCIVYVYILSKRLDLPEKEMLEIIIATSLHDIRRINDKDDENHGRRASKWFKGNFNLLEVRWKKLSQFDIEKISKIIKVHKTTYGKFEIGKQSYLPGIGILKMADALDRYRLPKLKWRIKKKYLKFSPTQSEKFFAYKLVIESEDRYLSSGDDSFISVIKLVSEYVKY